MLFYYHKKSIYYHKKSILQILCKKFAKNCIKNQKMAHMFPLNPSNVNTRNKEKYFVQPATTGRLAKSAIPYMQRLLNED